MKHALDAICPVETETNTLLVVEAAANGVCRNQRRRRAYRSQVELPVFE
jgi:hypothetical protein